MSLKYVQENDFCNIYGWMLGLEDSSGHRLDMQSVIIYAQVYGFTKSKGMFFYRDEWLAEWLNMDTLMVNMLVVRLLEAKLVERKWIKTKYGESFVLVAHLRDEDMNNG